MLHEGTEDRTDEAAPGTDDRDPAVDLLQARFERDLALKAQERLEKELRRFERRLAEVEAERTALRTRLEERERYLAAIRASRPWKLIQLLRGLVGRRW
jgi:hypothetical protein